MRLKRGIAAMLAAVTVFGLAGCGGSEKETAEGTENTATQNTGFVEKKVEPVNFDSGVELTDDCYHFIYALGNAPATIDAAKFFKMRLEQESKGTLSCDIYTDNVLGSERELLEGSLLSPLFTHTMKARTISRMITIAATFAAPTAPLPTIV